MIETPDPHRSDTRSSGTDNSSGGAGGDGTPGKDTGTARCDDAGMAEPAEAPTLVVDRMLAVVAGLLIAAMMGVTVVDVAGRYLFAQSLRGSFELTENLLAVVVFCALPFATAMRDHIAVGFLTQILPAGLRRVQTVLLDLLCAAISALIAWRLWEYADRLALRNETTMELGLSRGLIGTALAAGMALTALVFLVHAVRAAAFKRHIMH